MQNHNHGDPPEDQQAPQEEVGDTSQPSAGRYVPRSTRPSDEGPFTWQSSDIYKVFDGMRRPDLCWLVYSALIRIANEQGAKSKRPSPTFKAFRQAIRARAWIGRTSVDEALKDLQRAGLIRIQGQQYRSKENSGQPNTYTLLSIRDPKARKHRGKSAKDPAPSPAGGIPPLPTDGIHPLPAGGMDHPETAKGKNGNFLKNDEKDIASPAPSGGWAMSEDSEGSASEEPVQGSLGAALPGSQALPGYFDDDDDLPDFLKG